ncbi:MAG: TatD family hydrolase [Gammaproteobacteria bacterium]|nr:TatD family hydrolase [Gammaproteobacteria bacterium]
MLVDSHCHLHLMDLSEYEHGIQSVLDLAKENQVDHLLCVSVELAHHAQLCEIANQHPNVSISVGLHPNHETADEPSVDELVQLAQHPSCVAIGETGLDYYRVEQADGIELQQARLIRHIQASLLTQRPLIIHTRQAAEDTLALLKKEQAIGGVMHCFTETWEVAKAAMDLGFYISFSGIVTFKNAVALQDVAKRLPIERMLIETDSPYLAPAPYRGKQNHPALVSRVAEVIAELRGESFEYIAEATTENFYRCFPLAKRAQ